MSLQMPVALGDAVGVKVGVYEGLTVAEGVGLGKLNARRI